MTDLVYKALQRKKAKCITWLEYVGEQCVNDARLTGSYTDRTGNLRSSIGYIIIDNGQIVTLSGFRQVAKGHEGISRGKSFAQQIAAEIGPRLALVIVAGMNYAAYVQDRGYNVLDSAEELAQKLIPQLIK